MRAVAPNTPAEFLQDVLTGLKSSPKRLPSKYFYDDEGSRLFQKIMTLPEYYLTRAEAEILETHRERIAQYLGTRPFSLVELGAGDGTKTKLLIECFLHRKLDFSYVPIDISAHALGVLSQTLTHRFPALRIQRLACDYFHGLARLEQDRAHTLFVLFLGSNIGNFTPAETTEFLSCLRRALRSGDFALIGFDLKKDLHTLLCAYSDAAGVTRDFNLNLLRRINRELGATFNLAKFQHYATYNPVLGAMESYLISKEPQHVWIETAKETISFDAFEPIHTEYSFKYSEHDIARLADTAGFKIIENFYDRKRQFVDSLWQVC